jgi:hypothetical protein
MYSVLILASKSSYYRMFELAGLVEMCQVTE